MLTNTMPQRRTPGREIRAYIVAQLEAASANVVRDTTEHFGISRQAVNRHLQTLVGEKVIEPEGATRSRTYRLVSTLELSREHSLPLREDEVWRNDLAPLFKDAPENVSTIWHYGVSEMLNNASDHSGGSKVWITLTRTATSTAVTISDNGVGIFAKIQSALGLLDERHAVLELSKGKLTTDPAHHSGEGIFFSSRVFDEFWILSGTTIFSHRHDDADDWIAERPSKSEAGTLVHMRLRNDAKRTTKEVFDEYAGQDLRFTKTVVPVRLAQYGNEQLVSRSQAKRLLSRVDRFQTVVLNFQGVATIGQAFADEVFRVFSIEHPEITILPIHTAPEVEAMIARARNTVVS